MNVSVVLATIGLFALVAAYWTVGLYFRRYLREKHPKEWAQLDRPLGEFDKPLAPGSIGADLRTMRFVFLSGNYKSLGDRRVVAYVTIIRVLAMAILGYIVVLNIVFPTARH